MSNAIKKNTKVHLWFQKDELAKAMDKYGKIFESFKIKSSLEFDTPFGTCAKGVEFEIDGRVFQAIDAEPAFTFNPSFSMTLLRSTMEEVNFVWERLLAGGGHVIMPLDKYDFAECYGMLVDEFGLSWQVFYDCERASASETIPLFSFPIGKTKEALDFYTGVFHDSKINEVYYMDEEEKNVMFSCVNLNGDDFFASDEFSEDAPVLNESASIVVECDSQEEIDYYWERLSEDAEGGQCGWTKDKFGLSWQIVPKFLNELFFSGDMKQYQKMANAMYEMKKLDIAKLKAAMEE